MAVLRHVFALTVLLAARAPLRLAGAAGHQHLEWGRSSLSRSETCAAG